MSVRALFAIVETLADESKQDSARYVRLATLWVGACKLYGEIQRPDFNATLQKLENSGMIEVPPTGTWRARITDQGRQ